MDFNVLAFAALLLHTFLGSVHSIQDIAQLTETCKDSVLYPNPRNCGSFYNCAHGVLVEIQCQAGLHFNTVAGWCDYPALANCKVSPTEEPVTEVYSTLAPTTEEFELIPPSTTPTTTTEESTFEPSTTTETLITDYVEPVTNANTNQTPWTTTQQETYTTPTTQRPEFRDNCQFEYTTKISPSQPYFNINQLVDINYNDTINNVDEFKVLVRGEQDAKIVLAYQNDRSEIIPEYEIVLGENDNKRFSINRNGKYVSREKRDTLLSNNAWLPVIVRVHNDGLIELQIEGERNAFLSAKNKNHMKIDFVGFNNDGNRLSDWFFGCPIERQVERYCMQQYFTEINETNFTTFFDIQNLEQNRPSSDVKLTVYVDATRDVSILLSSVDGDSVESSAPSYEIRLAAGDKQKEHELHRNHERLDNESESNLLQPNVRVPIDILIEINGSIEVIVAGSKGIKLNKKDSYPVNVRFISFRSNVPSLTSRWYFDC